MKIITFSKRLEQVYGGKWNFLVGKGLWVCDDGIRYVKLVLTERDHEGEYTGKTSPCMYFMDGRAPEWVHA